MVNAVLALCTSAPERCIDDSFPVHSPLHVGPHRVPASHRHSPPGGRAHHASDTVTIIYQGEVECTGPAGFRNPRGPGDAQWQAALEQAIAQSERPEHALFAKGDGAG